jgi:hypothetical protein
LALKLRPVLRWGSKRPSRGINKIRQIDKIKVFCIIRASINDI